MTDAFDDDLLQRLANTSEVRIVTGPPDQPEAHRTTIWIVVDNQRRVMVRSVDGPGARWYREAAARGEASLELAGERIPVRVVAASDPDRIESASQGYLAKYRRSSSAQSMVADHTLETTLELLAR
jgi:hypothetical protein